MNTHGVKVLNGTNNDALVFAIAHHFNFNFFPANDTLLNEYFAFNTGGKGGRTNVFQVFHVVGDTAACPPKGKGRAQNNGKLNMLCYFTHFFDGAGNKSFWHLQPNTFNALAKKVTAFSGGDGMGICPDKLNPHFIKQTGFSKI